MALSELQVALIGIGVVVVGAVWGYNVWQERKYRRSAEALFKGGQAAQGDPLLGTHGTAATGEPRREPAVAAVPGVSPRIEPAIAETMPEDVVAEPAPAPSLAEAETPAAPVVEAEPPVDPLAECVVRFALSSGVTPAEMHAVSRAWTGAIGKPLRWLACARNGEWCEVIDKATTPHARWVAALQLVDRRGAASAAEIAAFLDGMAALVEGFRGDVVLPEAAEVQRQAEALDAFCASVDIQFGINVVEAKGSSFPATKLRGLCESAGMALRPDGRFHASDAAGGDSFTVSDIGGAAFEADAARAAPLHGVTFTLDVPRVADGAREFDRMLAVAQQMARAIGGVLVDAQRQPLAEAMIGMIRNKVVELQQRMLEADIPAGGERARKLFA